MTPAPQRYAPPDGAGKDIASYHAVPQAGAAAVTDTLPALNRAIMAQTVPVEPKYCQKDSCGYAEVSHLGDIGGDKS